MEKLIEEMIELVCEKKELKNIEKNLIMESVIQELTHYPNLRLSSSKADKKEIASIIRAKLRKINSQYSKVSYGLSNWEEILKMHSSTRERIEFYPLLREKIRQINSEKILDLGCGLNPIALAQKRYIYYAVDVHKEELTKIEEYLKENKINGKTYSMDLRKIKIEDFEEVDLALAWKVLDLLDDKGHKNAERLLENIKAKKWLISFATKTLSGKKMQHPRREWLERMLDRKEFEYTTFSLPNELFYYVRIN